MLAKTEDFNVLYNDKLVVVLVEDCAINNVSQVLLVALGEVHHGLCITHGCAMETFSFRVLSDAFEKCTDCSRELL